MSKERLKEILNNLLGWGSEHSDTFMESMVEASGMTKEEAKELDVEEWCE